jgi:hypothetical protein
MTSKKVVKQIGNEEYIQRGFSSLVNQFVDLETMPAIPLPPDAYDEICNLAALLAQLRKNVNRDYHSRSKAIAGVDEAESPGRITKALLQVCRAHACLMRRNEIDASDLALARRIVLDSIPAIRHKVLAALLAHRTHELTIAELVELTEIPRTTLRKVVEDLQCIKVIQKDPSEAEGESFDWISLTPEFVNLWSGVTLLSH